MSSGGWRVVGTLLVIGSILLLVRALSVYTGVGVGGSSSMDALSHRLRSIEVQLGSLAGIANGAINTRRTPTGRDRLQRLDALEENYMKVSGGLIDSVKELTADPTFRFVFQPGDPLPTRLTELTEWLAADREQDHPIVPEYRGINEKLSVLAPRLMAYVSCMHVTNMRPVKLREDMNGCFVEKSVGLQPLP